MKQEFVWSYGLDGIEGCKLVREAVFVDEQGFSVELEFDNTDTFAHHLLIKADSKPAAAARIFIEGDTNEWHAGRICIMPEYRGTGLGLVLMHELERKVSELGGSRIVLSSQVRVRPFYEKAGYTAYGEEYLDEHCPHISMAKTVQK